MPEQPVKHFRNVLGPLDTATSSDGGRKVPESELSPNPADMSCEKCLERLGRLRQANMGTPKPPNDPKRGA